jgi:hypothetical protein
MGAVTKREVSTQRMSEMFAIIAETIAVFRMLEVGVEGHFMKLEMHRSSGMCGPFCFTRPQTPTSSASWSRNVPGPTQPECSPASQPPSFLLEMVTLNAVTLDLVSPLPLQAPRPKPRVKKPWLRTIERQTPLGRGRTRPAAVA